MGPTISPKGKFTLTKGQESFELDVQGNASQSGVKIGSWSTTKDNKIRITRQTGAAVDIDVAWNFNSANQLVLKADNQEMFNFHSDINNTPRYVTENAVLQVKPSASSPFTFALRGEWDLSENHDLAITINGVKSVIDGFIQDRNSRFIFRFFNKKDLLQSYALGFAGTWKNEIDASGTALLAFQYNREDGTTDTFTLPAKGVKMDTTVNQLMYEYQKDGKTRRIQFVGRLDVSPTFEVTYAIDRQTSGDGRQMVGQTVFQFGALITNREFAGNLELALKRADGTAGATTLSIRGKFTALRGTTQLQVGFTFEQERGPNIVRTTFGIAGSLETTTTAIRWAFAANSVERTITLSIGADIRLGPAKLDPALNLIMANGQVAGITFLLGIAF